MAQDKLDGDGGDYLNMAPLVEPIRDEPDNHMGDRQGQEVKHPVMKPDATFPNQTIRGHNCVEISNANTSYRQHRRSPCFLYLTYHVFFKHSNLASVSATVGFSLSCL